MTESRQLVFRDRRTIESQLHAAGFHVDAVYRDWHRAPFAEDAPVMAFVASSR